MSVVSYALLTRSSPDFFAGDSLLYHSDNMSCSNKTDEEAFKTSDSGIASSVSVAIKFKYLGVFC